MDDRDRELLIEAAAGAWRPHSARELPVHPAWYDLDEPGRRDAFEVALVSRTMEAAADPDGWSSTVHSVLRVIADAADTT